jgi:hypothetical protein
VEYADDARHESRRACKRRDGSIGPHSGKNDSSLVAKHVEVGLFVSKGDNVISYIEMCRREGLSLQAGMNFGVGERTRSS